MKTRIAPWGSTEGIQLLREALEQAGPTAGDAVRVEGANGRSPLEKAGRVRGRYRLEDLVARMPEEHQPQEEPWGTPVGLEKW